MFTDVFFLLRFYGVPVTVTEWLALMRALAVGLAPASLDQFYAVAQHPPRRHPRRRRNPQ